VTPFDPALLPAGVRSRILPGVNGLSVHLLEAGEAGQPAVLLLHGFPELAFSWRKVMPALERFSLSPIQKRIPFCGEA
jgi:pimeloyl-ACP methyl ester carboxylesterase